ISRRISSSVAWGTSGAEPSDATGLDGRSIRLARTLRAGRARDRRWASTCSTNWAPPREAHPPADTDSPRARGSSTLVVGRAHMHVLPGRGLHEEEAAPCVLAFDPEMHAALDAVVAQHSDDKLRIQSQGATQRAVEDPEVVTVAATSLQRNGRARPEVAALGVRDVSERAVHVERHAHPVRHRADEGVPGLLGMLADGTEQVLNVLRPHVIADREAPIVEATGNASGEEQV